MENKKIVLVIEDEKPLRNVLRDKLISEGFLVTEAKDGEEGLNMSLEEHPDLILLDLLLPKMDGMEMLKKLRINPWGKNVPVIILTNLSGSDEERNKEITELEPTYYLMKTDESMDDIVDKIKERLGLFK